MSARPRSGSCSKETTSELSARVLPCGKPPCPEHGATCAFHRDEPGRCPWCHAPWAALDAKRGRGYVDDKGVHHEYEWREVHSCEQPTMWRSLPLSERRLRVLSASRKREQALAGAEDRWESGPCSHEADSRMTK